MSNEMNMDEMIEVLARYRYNAKHDADRIKALEDELSRLRASSFVTAVPSADYEKLKEENAHLKAEVEHIKFWNGQLKAENDLLRKAGEAMAYRVDDMMGVSKEYAKQMLNDWNFAKEGKPSV